jgi:histidinol-phosphatase (PHP family)
MNNFHTHTFRCLHASGEVIEYAQKAAEQGCTKLGISDHCPYPDGRWPHVRMHNEDLASYLNAIDYAAAEIPELQLYKGLECEFVPSYKNYFREYFLGEAGMAYLAAGAHWFPWHGEWISTYRMENTGQLAAYSKHIEETAASGLFSFLAHPDLFGVSFKSWNSSTLACSRDIIQAAAECGLPLEINGYGFRKNSISTPEGKRRQYPWEPFWELCSEYKVKVIINSDAHRPEDVTADMDKCLELAEKYKLETVELFE